MKHSNMKYLNQLTTLIALGCFSLTSANAYILNYSKPRTFSELPDDSMPVNQPYQGNSTQYSQPNYQQGYQPNNYQNPPNYQQEYQPNNYQNPPNYQQGYQPNNYQNPPNYQQGYQQNNPQNQPNYQQGYQQNNPQNQPNYQQGYQRRYQQNRPRPVPNQEDFSQLAGNPIPLPINNRNIDNSTSQEFRKWLNGNRQRTYKVREYQNYLSNHLGWQNVPPMDQLLTTARSWEECHAEPFAVPPKNLWKEMLPTLQLYSKLKQSGFLPNQAVIRSVYRNPMLNECAKGAKTSMHLQNNAIDIFIPSFVNNAQLISQLEKQVCHFWQTQGEMYNFGLGFYKSGSIHIDTSRYRTWGNSHGSGSSPCLQ